MSARRVAVVGAGLIGRAWSLVFARAGFEVRVSDADADVLAALPERLAADVALLERHGLCASAADVLDRVAPIADLAETLDGVELVQENGPEDVDVKRALFAELDALAPPGAILASSTSAIVASRFTGALAGRGRCLVAHPVNPPHLVPLVELCAAPWTEERTLERARELYTDVGQVPITVEREIEGFVLNRLQGALLAESFRLVADGVVSPEDLDRTLKDGLGLRWSFMGPFETIELNAPGGIADYCARYCAFYARLADDPPTSAAFGDAAREAVANAWPHAPSPERLAGRTAWRDERLAALRAHRANVGKTVPEPASGPVRSIATGAIEPTTPSIPEEKPS